MKLFASNNSGNNVKLLLNPSFEFKTTRLFILVNHEYLPVNNALREAEHIYFGMFEAVDFVNDIEIWRKPVRCNDN